MELAKLYSDHSSLLFGVAYRMLGSVSDAEDIVQDVYEKFSRQDSVAIDNMQGYLIRMTTNHCINLIQSSRRKRELYPGTWLPEPLPDTEQGDPSATAERHEQIQYAILVMLQALGPFERAVYILKDTLGYPYHEIANVVNKSENNCRKIYSRARNKLRLSSQESIQPIPDSQVYLDTFMNALQTGDVDPLVKILLEDVVILSDGGGKVRAAYNPIVGIERVYAFMKGLQGKGAFEGRWSVVRLNDGHAMQLECNGNIKLVFLFQTNANCTGISRIYIILNPDKLRLLKNH